MHEAVYRGPYATLRLPRPGGPDVVLERDIPRQVDAGAAEKLRERGVEIDGQGPEVRSAREEAFWALTVPVLRDLASERNVHVSGRRKADYVAALAAAA